MGSEVPRQFAVAVFIDVGSDPITGSIANRGELDSAFHGWLELLAALDAIHRGDRTDSHAANHDVTTQSAEER